MLRFARMAAEAEAREITASYRRGFGGSMRRSEPQWHKPERPWPHERKEKLRATMQRREEEKRARRKALPQAARPRREAAVRALALADLIGEIMAAVGKAQRRLRRAITKDAA